MTPLELAAACLGLGVSVLAGTVAHELSHAAMLKLVGVPYDFRWLPGRTDDDAKTRLSGALASVVPRQDVERDAATGLRVAALMPFVLALPLLAVPFGVVPDPFSTGHLPVQMAVVGWLGCSLPSPQDFSVAFHAERALERTPDVR